MQAENVAMDEGNAYSTYKCDIRIKLVDRHNLLRPKIVESLFILHYFIKDPKFVEQ